MRFRNLSIALRSIALGSIALSVLALGCTTKAPAQPAPPKAADSEEVDTARVPQGSPPPEPQPQDRTGPRDRDELEVIRPGHVVPAFKLTAEDGTVLDSEELVGHRPFVMVFFASWCRVCERKLPDVRKALENAGKDILIIGVALDNPDTWKEVADYVKRHDIEDFKLVNGQANRDFARAYNPFGSVPVVEVIDRGGVIAELQRGYKTSHRDELIAALELVGKTAPSGP
jgi:peroxiredoxin